MKKIIAALFIAFAAPVFATVPGTDSRIAYTGNGSTTVFAFSFSAQASTDIEVYVGGTKLIGGYTVALNANQSVTPGGSVTFSVAPLNSASVTLQRAKPITQGTSLSPYSPFPAKTIEKTFDGVVMQVQQVDRHVGDVDSREASDFAQVDAKIAATLAAVNAGVNNSASITATNGTVPRTLANAFADVTVPRWYASVQAAINAAPTGGTVFVPEGSYSESLTISKSLTLDMAKGATITCTSGAAVTVSNATGVKIRGGKLSLSSGCTYGVTPSGTITDLSIDGVTITGTGVVADAQQGFGSNSGQTLTNIQIVNNTISNVTIGISLNADLSGSITGGLIQGNHITNVVGGNAGQGYGIHHANGSGSPSYVRIIGNVIDGAQRHSIYQAKGKGVVIQGNTIRNHRATLAGGDSHGVQRPAISIGRSSGVTVVANVIESPQDCAIDVFPATGWPISNIAINNNVIRNWQSFPAITLGTTAPSTDGVPTAVLIENNQLLTDASVTGTGLEAIRVYATKGASILGNWLEMDNGTNGQLIDFQGTSEGALTANYTDDIRVVANHGSMSGTGQRFVRFETAFLNAASRAEFYLNRVTVSGSGASTFNLPTGQTNPNIFAYGQAIDGLNNDAIHPAILSYELPLPKYATATYAAGIAADCSVASVWTVTATDATAFGFNSPSNCTKGQVITMTVRNASGGALNAQDPFGVASYKHGAWTQPANGYSRSITFRHDGSNLIEISRTPIDVPN